MTAPGVHVFTYGTLAPGERAGAMLARWPVVPAVVDGWTCYTLPRDGFPFVVKGSGTVPGFCYTVPRAVLARLDRYEGVPTLYVRAHVVARLESGEHVRAILYRWAGPIPADAVRLPSGVRWTAREHVRTP